MFNRNKLKRISDLVLLIPAMIVFLPIMIIIALLIFATIGKPVLFRQYRPGLYGKQFLLYKFRTMTDKRDYNNNHLYGLASMTYLLPVAAPWFALTRAVQGASAGAIEVASMSAVAALFSEAQRGRAVSRILAAQLFGIAIGPVAGVVASVSHLGMAFFVDRPRESRRRGRGLQHESRRQGLRPVAAAADSSGIHNSSGRSSRRARAD